VAVLILVINESFIYLLGSCRAEESYSWHPPVLSGPYNRWVCELIGLMGILIFPQEFQKTWEFDEMEDLQVSRDSFEDPSNPDVENRT